MVEVSTENGTASDVSVALTAKPASQKPAFTSGCGKADGTATCTVSSVSDKQATDLDAQIPVASSDTSVTAVTLTATATITTTATWTPPAAAESISVTAATASPSPSASSTSAGASTSEAAEPLGPLPDLNSTSTSLIGPGNAAGLFPAISPSGTSSANVAGAAAAQGASGNARPVADSSALALGKPVLTAQVVGLVVLALAILLAVTRLSVLRRFRVKKRGS